MKAELGFTHFIQQADAVAISVLIIMLLMSISTWYWIVVKCVEIYRAHRNKKRFLESFWSAAHLSVIYGDLNKDGSYDAFSRLTHQGLRSLETHRTGKSRGLIDAGTPEEFVTRSLKQGLEQERLSHESGMTWLATVASSAPFIGLFGTVWGIYHALLAIGISGQGTLDKVAGPVGEALIMTAIGLSVAIPAAVAYNAMTRANRRSMAALDDFAHELLTIMTTGMKDRSGAKIQAPIIESERSESGALASSLGGS